jgi:hypothetical protein
MDQMRETITIKRDELYKEVWGKPMTHLSKKYGLSDNGLRKICRKLNVPTPTLGYWTKIQHGKKIPKTPLPEIKYGEQGTYKLCQTSNKNNTKKKITSMWIHISRIQ